MIKDMANNLFPSLKTFLAPAKDIGNIKFVKLSEIAGARPDYVTQSDIEQANFTRPNSPEDPTESGATVIDADGTIRKLAEDEAPWSYPEGGAANGCLKLVEETGKKNRVAAPESQPTERGVTITDAGFFGDVKFWKVDFPDVSGGSAAAEFVLDALITGDYFCSAYVNCPQGENFLLGFSLSEARAEVFNGSGQISRFATKQTASTEIKMRITRRGPYTNTNPVTIYIAAPQVEEAGSYTKPTSYIPANVTRNNYTHPFNDLINKGVFGSSSGSVYLELENVIFDETTSNKNYLEMGTSNTSDYIRLRGRDSNKIVQINGFGLNETINISNATKIVITWDKKTVKVFSSGAKDGEKIASSDVNISEVFERGQAARSIITINNLVNLSFAPYAIPEATAAALTA